MIVTDLATRSTVRAIVLAFAESEREIRAAFATIVIAEKRVNAAFGYVASDGINVNAGFRGSLNFADPDEVIERMARDAWGLLVDRLELRRFMSVGRAKELDEQLCRGTLPQITEAAVFDFAAFYRENIDAMFNEAVVEVFDWLRPPRSEYKTNHAWEIRECVVLESMVKPHFCGGGRFEVSYHREQRFTALENVFSALDGKGMVGTTHQSALRMAIEASVSGHAETPFFKVKMFKKGTIHLKFKRPDLLTELNRRAGGLRMRPANGPT